MNTDRRFFLKALALVSASTSFNPSFANTSTVHNSSSLGSDDNLYKNATAEELLPKLPYAYNALEPYIDEETMKIHHDIHHLGYIKGLIEAQKELAQATKDQNFKTVQHWSKRASFCSGGHYMHSLFWKIMTPAGSEKTKISIEFKGILSKYFGTYDAFKGAFSATAKSVEGSGWGALSVNTSDGSLSLHQIENQHKLTPAGTIPILAIDVWEHAYYLKYKNKRGVYIKNWWNIINWTEVESLYKELTNK